MSVESSPTTISESIATMTKLLEVLNFERWADDEVPFKDGMIKPTEYLAVAGPMATLMINNFLDLKPTPNDHPEQFESMQALMAGRLGLKLKSKGKWVKIGGTKPDTNAS